MKNLMKGDKLPEIGQAGIIYYANGARYKWISGNWWYVGEVS